MSNQPIGVIDSGIGGLGIFKTVIELLPSESLIYFADSNRCPYGAKNQKEIQGITKSIVGYLIAKFNIKLAVIACNTATVAGIDFLRESFPEIPFVGVVPVIKPASSISKTKQIGCLATDTTVKSNAQADLIKDFAGGNQVEVHNVACHGLVELIEAGLFTSDETINTVKRYLNPLLEKNIDALALGCTHYTLIRDLIEQLVPKHIQVMDSNLPVAQQTKRILESRNLISKIGQGEYRFLVNGDPNQFSKIVKPYLNGYFKKAEQVNI